VTQEFLLHHILVFLEAEMENPATWNLLTSSLAVCDLQMPDKVWSFLALQGLVRDAPGDREFFYGIIQQEKSSGAITGPSLQSRIAGRLQEFGIALALAAEPDANAEMARKRLQTLNDLLKSKEPLNRFRPSEAPRNSGHCTWCGIEVNQELAACPRCGANLTRPSAANADKFCQHCQKPNPPSAPFCQACGESFGGLNCFVVNGDRGFRQPASPSDSSWHGYCFRCGMNIHSDEKFCRCCGTNLLGLSARPVNGSMADRVARDSRNTGELKDDGRTTYVQWGNQPIPRQAQLKPERTPQSDYWQTRLFRLIDIAEDDRSVADFLGVLFSAIQDLAVIKQLLTEKGVWDEELYKKLRTERLIADHSGAGATPWKSYSYYPYTLDEEEFLEELFNASKEEIARFKEKVETISELS
jgi:hypothetical protein